MQIVDTDVVVVRRPPGCGRSRWPSAIRRSAYAGITGVALAATLIATVLSSSWVNSMSTPSAALKTMAGMPPAQAAGYPWWKALAPIAVAIIIAVLPPPEGLPQHAWYYFAIFAGVVVALMFEPLPGGAIGLIGVTLVVVLANTCTSRPTKCEGGGEVARRGDPLGPVRVLQHHGVADLRRVHVRPRVREDRPRPAHRADACEGDGTANADPWLRRRVRRPAARPVHAVQYGALGGTLFPVIQNLPGLYDSKPNDPSARRSAAT